MWNTFGHVVVCWDMLVHVRLCWDMLVCTELICWAMLGYDKICWDMLEHAEVCWDMLDILRPMQMDATLLGPTCCVRLHGITTMLALVDTCCV